MTVEEQLEAVRKELQFERDSNTKLIANYEKDRELNRADLARERARHQAAINACNMEHPEIAELRKDRERLDRMAAFIEAKPDSFRAWLDSSHEQTDALRSASAKEGEESK